MARVITFSTKFPSYHPLKGQPTDFIGKIWASLLSIDNDLYSDYLHPDGRPPYSCSADTYLKLFGDKQKHHTIRAGNRWKVGDKFSPRFWGGKPYRSKQVTFAPDIEIKKVWNVVIESQGLTTYVMFPTEIHSQFQLVSIGDIAVNDGLSNEEFERWFNPKKKYKYFEGQVICWNDKIEY